MQTRATHEHERRGALGCRLGDSGDQAGTRRNLWQSPTRPPCGRCFIVAGRCTIPPVLQEHDYEILVLLAVEHLGGKPKRADVLRLMGREMMPEILAQHPEEQEDRKSGAVITWENKASWARERLKKKGQISMPAYGIWAITAAGSERLCSLRQLAPKLSVSALRKAPPEKRAQFYAQLVEIFAKSRADGYEI